MTQLSWYLNDTASLLRDGNFQFTSKNQLIRWINLARRQIALRTGCIQLLITGQSPFGTSSQPGFFTPGAAVPGMLPGNAPNNANAAGANNTASNSFNTIPGLEYYPYTFANAYARAANAGVKAIVYVFNVSVSWGGIRPTLNWVPWDDIQAYARSYNVGAFAYPFVWSSLGVGENGQVWLFPCPSVSTPGEMEWQCNCIPIDLTNDSDYEAIPNPYQSAVKYYAASMAYLGSQRTGQAQIMMELFNDQIETSTVGSDMGHVPDYYWEQN